MTAPIFVLPAQINTISGPQLLSYLFNGGLLGVLTVQVYLYYLAFSKDPIYTKVIVYGLYALEFAQTVVVIDAAYRNFVLNFMDPYVFDKIGLLWLVPPLTAVATLFVQGYYALRLKILTDSKKIPVIIIALSIAQLGGAIAVGVYAREKKFYTLLTTPDMLLQAGLSTGFFNVGSVICDLIIATYMTYYLSRFDTKMKHTKVLLTKTIRLTIETGTLTTVVGMICFALAIIPTSPYYYQTPMGIIGKIYVNSMLVLLNSRITLGSEDDPNDPSEAKPQIELQPLEFKHDTEQHRSGALSGLFSAFETEGRPRLSQLDGNDIMVVKAEDSTTRTYN